MRVKPLLLLIAAVALLLTGCGKSGSEGTAAKPISNKPATIEVGNCFKGDRVGDRAPELAKKIGTKSVTAIEDDPTWADPVDCAKPHRISVYGLVGLPPELDQEVSSYAKLLRIDSDLYAQVRNSVNRSCSLALPGVRKALKKTDLRLQITPAVNAKVGELTFNPVPFANWEAGQRQFVCIMNLHQADTLTLTDFLTSSGQASNLHLCYNPNSQPVDCGEPHTMESAAIIVANQAVADGQLPDKTGFVNGTLNVSADIWDSLDRVCTTFIRANSNLPRGLTGVTSLYDSQWPIQGTEDYAFYCDATSPYGTPPRKMTRSTGSVFNR